MLQETNNRFATTSWMWLTDPDETENDELIQPFDCEILRMVPAQNAQTSPTTVPTGDEYQLDGDDQARFDAIHRTALARAVAVLPHNGRIAAGHTVALHAEAEAEMGTGPTAAIGATALAGTDGVSPCVAVLARAPVDGGRWRVGCSHLSANEMGSLQEARDAIDQLLTSLAAVSQETRNAPVELYVVGGCEDENVAYEEFGRVIAAAQMRAADPGSDQVLLAGVRVPACAGQQYVDVYIGAGGVTYSIHQRD
ncbi:hypothetical protein GCM10027280_05860 [Micromonospora polyrhachis]|uniref:Uncharacterized protein n=1 Tax=Micromonospora polyrhachis TaxID=1282883 RepID=A0A7W7SMV4_9ACTN|nr:hypothetical protein [Micromonospora polyrhachis]MBB4956505.1 hypothetical protein [Micromonospora polyrhachis]